LTDHKSFRELMSQVIQTPEQYYYLSKLLGFDYTIQYKPSASNIIVDALSRVPSKSHGQLLLLSIPHFDFIDDLRRMLHANSDFQAQLSKVCSNPSDYRDYNIHNDLLLFQGCIWLNKNNPYIPTLLFEFHGTPLGGHLGVVKTTHRLESNFFWPTLRQNVKQFVRECKICQ